MKGKHTTAACGGVLVAALVFLAGCSAKPAQPTMIRDAVPVSVATVTAKTVPVEVRAIGTGEAYSSVAVKAQVTGELTGVYFKEGQDVKRGELLFAIDRRPFEAALNQAEANLARDIAQAENARAQARRYAKLFEDGVASKEQYDQVQTNADALDAAVRADKAAVERAKLELDYCKIVSPMDARTGSLLVHPGNIVKANDTPSLVLLNQIAPIYVNFALPQQYLAAVKKYMAGGKLKVAAFLPSDDKRPEVGVLTFVDNAVDTTTGTIRLKATFTNGERRLWPGEFVNVVLRLTEQPNAIVVPSQAVQTGQTGSYVFVVTSDLKAESRAIVVARTQGGETVVEKGLRPGEKVVTDGQLRLVPGAKVEVKSGLGVN